MRDKPVELFRVFKNCRCLCQRFRSRNSADIFSKEVRTRAGRVKARRFEHFEFFTVKTVFIAGAMVIAQERHKIGCVFWVLNAPFLLGKQLQQS